MNQNWFRNVLSNPKSSLGIRLLFSFLLIISFFFRSVIYLRKLFYRFGLKNSYTALKPVISIGNITAGGTGKTPLVIWICKYLSEKGLKPGILTRGYKSGKGKISDEPALLAKSCPKAEVVVNSDRVKGGQKAVLEHNCDVLVMDDGFGHIRLKRDLDIITIDATCPFGYVRLLPAGLLREPLKSVRRADAAIITRCDLVCAEVIDEIRKKLIRLKENIIIAESVHKPLKGVFMKGNELGLDELKTKKIYAFCGIGNPDSFFKTLEKCGIQVLGSRVYNDHYNYLETDLTDIYEEARYLQADVILTTQKDWVKTALLYNGDSQMLFGYLAIELSLIEGREKIEELINSVL